MDGKGIFKEAVRRLPEVTNEALQQAGLDKEDIDLFIPHQANMRINQFYQQMMKLPEEKVFHNIQRYGNTTAATIPLALDEALEMGLVGKGSTVLFLDWGPVLPGAPTFIDSPSKGSYNGLRDKAGKKQKGERMIRAPFVFTGPFFPGTRNPYAVARSGEAWD